MSDAAPDPLELLAVRNHRGGPWDWTRPMREQEGWKEHAAFMNALVDEGLILLGGPLEGDQDTLLIFSAPSAEVVRDRLAQDPWARSGMLTVTAIERWTILLSPEALDALMLELTRPSGTAGSQPQP
jgi:uncharacterized protein YciI